MSDENRLVGTWEMNPCVAQEGKAPNANYSAVKFYSKNESEDKNESYKYLWVRGKTRGSMDKKGDRNGDHGAQMASLF